MKLLLFVLTFCLASFINFSQVNMSQIGHVDFSALHGGALNDVWGYVDESGIEYALVGSTLGTSVVSLEDPANPVEVYWEPGAESIWRDLKVNGDYAYITTEATSGVLIIDLSPLPLGAITSSTYYNGVFPVNFESAHNIYIDEQGYAYIFGANYGVGGTIILDLNTNPTNPDVVHVIDDYYVHDGYARNDTLYCANIGEGFLSIYDISDRTNPILLGTKNTSTNFTHNIWPSADGSVVFTTDEKSGSFIESYDITDPSNIIELDKIQSSPGAGVIPHNVHVNGNFLVTSYYSDGIVVHDVTYPYNMVEVASFDTYPLQTTGYDGCWGAYPFLPSGLILATDREEGLFILGIDYQQACYLEGKVTEQGSGFNIEGCEVSFIAGNNKDLSDVNGDYAVGTLNSGTYTIRYDKIGYYPVEVDVNLTQGVITYQNVELVAIPPYNIDVTVLEFGTELPIENANIRFQNNYYTHDGVTNALGQENLTLFYETDFLITAGKWGYVTECMTSAIDNGTLTYTIHLKKGIYDDFSFDFGWGVSGSAATGQWERAIPYPYQLDTPQKDVDLDCGDYAFVTGNLMEDGYGVDDVDDGITVLFSPIFDLTGFTDPYVNFAGWFFNFYEATIADDYLRVVINDGVTSVELDRTYFEMGVTNEWFWRSIKVSDFITPNSTMQIQVSVADYAAYENITEAGFDRFYISEGPTYAGVETMQLQEFTIAPNPFNNHLTISGVEAGHPFKLINMSGQQVMGGVTEEGITNLDVIKLKAGIYFIQIGNQIEKVIKY